ncbi:Protein CBG15995 [Caenorhabditis briggsae]|uniref:Protein CBG15995 n=1 Tax=Caenorhabditis briggsae TaxID=6238 RepID=A8XNB7_CAEBR|nr:Protein CBG15995 [Caenorhabditis briggsae]CAP34348.2 Protein CBG15995 [Caenorhabditis briggsae]
MIRRQFIFVFVAVANGSNYNTVNYSNPSSIVNNLVISGFPQVTTTFTCDPEAQLWSVQGQTGQFTNFACIWKYLNGPFRL